MLLTMHSSLKKIARMVAKAGIAASILSVIAAAGGYVLLRSQQEWISGVIIEFTNKDAVKGYAIDGTKTEKVISELRDVAVLSDASSKIKTFTADQLADSLTITPIIPEDEVERRESAMKNGNEYEFFPTQYFVKYVIDEDKSVQNDLTLITQSFFDYFTEHHIAEREIPADRSELITADGEYLRSADQIRDAVDEMLGFLEEMSEKYPNYRSRETGLGYSDLLAQYEFLKKWDVAELYTRILNGRLARMPEIIVAEARKTIALNAENRIDTEEDLNHVVGLLESYSDKNKVRDNRGQYQSDKDNSIDLNHDNIIDDVYENATRPRTAYDGIMDKYINEGDQLGMMEEEDVYNNYLISVFEGVAPASAKQDEEITQEIIRQKEALNDLYNIVYLTNNEHREVLSASNIRAITTPYKEVKYRLKVYALVLGLGTFIMSGIGLLWLMMVAQRLKEMRVQEEAGSGMQETHKSAGKPTETAGKPAGN